MGWRVPIVKKRKFLGFLDKNNILGNLVAFMIFFSILAPNQVLVVDGTWKRKKSKISQIFGEKTILGTLLAFIRFFLDFCTVPYQNRKNIVNFSSLWLNTRFWEPWLHVRFAYVFS